MTKVLILSKFAAFYLCRNISFCLKIRYNSSMKKNCVISFVVIMLCSLLFSCRSLASEKNDPGSESAEKILSELSVQQKVGQLFFIQPDQLDFSVPINIVMSRSKVPHTHLSSGMADALEKYPAGGFVFFAKNIKNPRQLRRFVRQLKDASAIAPVIAVDEEGGRVARLARNRKMGLENVGPMLEVGKTGDVSNARKAGEYIGQYLSEYGFTMDFAPDADVNTNPENIVIGDRAFGSDPELVAEMAGAFLEGLHSKGIKGCLKHFPGHGDTKDDTHADYVAVVKSWEELKKCELIPFVRNFDSTDAVMLAHVTLASIEPGALPSSLSKTVVTKKLREELGYKGIILTDVLAMGAIEKNYGSAKAALLAVEAGNDIILMPQDFAAAFDAVLEAVQTGKISEKRIDESVLRILRFKGYR